MFSNHHAQIKGSTKVITPELHYLNDHTEQCLRYAIPIFGLEVDTHRYVGKPTVELPTRMVTSTQAVKVYNFTREPVTNVSLAGVRNSMPTLIMDECFWGLRSTTLSVDHSTIYDSTTQRLLTYGWRHTDLSGLHDLLMKLKIDPTGNVVVVRFNRIVGKDAHALRSSLRSLCMTDDMIREIELNHLNHIPTENGFNGYYRDLLSVTLIHENTLSRYPAVLDVYSGTQLSFLPVEHAPTHVHDLREEVIRSQEAGDRLRAHGANVAQYAIYYKDVEPLPCYIRDAGVVIELPIVQSNDKPEGYYKTWYEYDDFGRLTKRELFLEINKLKENMGFFKSKLQARLWSPESEVKDFKNVLQDILRRHDAVMTDIRSGITRSFQESITRILNETLGVVVERDKVVKSLREQLESAQQELKRTKERSQQEIDELRRTANRNKDTANTVNNSIKVLGTAIGFITTVVIPLLRSKKKPT